MKSVDPERTPHRQRGDGTPAEVGLDDLGGATRVVLIGPAQAARASPRAQTAASGRA